MAKEIVYEIRPFNNIGPMLYTSDRGENSCCKDYNNKLIINIKQMIGSAKGLQFFEYEYERIVFF